MKTIRMLGAALLLAGFASLASAATIDFADLSLAPDSYFRTDASTSFSSGGATFYYDAPFGECCWAGFTYSNLSDTTTPGFLNDGSAITGAGRGGEGDIYAVAFGDGAYLEFDSPQGLVGAWFTNTTYAYLAMHDGDDGNATPFIKGPFGEDDFFTLTVTGLDANGAALASLDVALADGTDILADWTWIDLSSLGVVSGLSFSFASSDSGQWGINTPMYFAIDDISTVPVPGALWLFGSALGVAGIVRRRRKLAA